MSGFNEVKSVSDLCRIIIGSYVEEFQKVDRSGDVAPIDLGNNPLKERVEETKRMVEAFEKLKIYTNSFIKFKSPYYNSALSSQTDVSA